MTPDEERILRDSYRVLAQENADLRIQWADAIQKWYEMQRDLADAMNELYDLKRGKT